MITRKHAAWNKIFNENNVHLLCFDRDLDKEQIDIFDRDPIWDIITKDEDIVIFRRVKKLLND